MEFETLPPFLLKSWPETTSGFISMIIMLKWILKFCTLYHEFLFWVLGQIFQFKLNGVQKTQRENFFCENSFTPVKWTLPVSRNDTLFI